MAPPKFRFTSFDLNSCIEMVKAVQDNGGLLSSVELADRLGYKSANNGSFNTRLANTRLFGLITGPSSAMKPTERALAILHPDYPATGVRARLEAFLAVPLYEAVLNQYHGQPLPDEAGLRNALATRWEISAEKAPMVLARLMDSADQAGLFSVGGRGKMIRPTLPAGTAAPRQEERPPARQADDGGDDDHDDHHHHIVEHDGGGQRVRANKIVDGSLDMLPDARQWDEAGLAHWLRFFEDALRLYYKLPREAHSTSSPSANGAENAGLIHVGDLHAGGSP